MKNRWLGTALAAGCILGCGQPDTSCERTSADARAILEECGVEFDDYPDDLGSPCTEQVSGIYACYLDCYEEASCEAILFKDQAAVKDFRACRNACIPQ